MINEPVWLPRLRRIDPERAARLEAIGNNIEQADNALTRLSATIDRLNTRRPWWKRMRERVL